MLICCKACLRLKERSSVEELGKIVRKWVEKYPNSEWAHLFNYMIHFPIPNRSLAAFNQSAKESIKKCDRIVREKTGIGFRKSGAEYFLGKGISLYAIASVQSLQREFPSLETKWEKKTDFWRSNEISEKLERVCGQKDVNFNGVITYQEIQLRFDNTRYPNQSQWRSCDITLHHQCVWVCAPCFESHLYVNSFFKARGSNPDTLWVESDVTTTPILFRSKDMRFGCCKSLRVRTASIVVNYKSRF